MDRLATPTPDFGAGEVGARAELAVLRAEHERLIREAEGLRGAAEVVLDEPDTQRLAQALARQFGLLVGCERAWMLVMQDGQVVARGSWSGSDSTDAEAVVPSQFTTRGLQIYTVASASGGHELFTPVIDHQRRLLGVLQGHDSNPFRVEQIRVAQALAPQAALGLERARLFDRMRDWTGSLEMLLSFNAVINQHIEPAQLVRRLVENAARFLQADGGRTGLAVPSDQPGGRAMISDAYWYRGQWHERQGRWEYGHGIPGFLLESEFSYIANECREDRLGDASLIADYDVRRSLCVPIKNMDETILGFFELLRGPVGAPFTWQDAAFLESLGNTTAVAIHNAQLLKALEIKSEQIQALSANHVKRLEEERTHIARELHDEAGQVLIGIKLGLQLLSRSVPPEPPGLREDFDRLRELVNQSTVQIKDLARRLRPPILDQLGILVALRQMAKDYSVRAGFPVVCDLDELPQRLPDETEIALYRIAQEALTNATRYAGARRVEIRLAREGATLQLCIEDDGVGFNPASVGAGLGLLGMRERADMLGAKFQLETRPGGGTRITVTIPYDNSTDHAG